MKKPERTPPQLLLSTEALLGITRNSRGRTLETMRRYQDSKSLAVALSKALDAGADGILVTPSTAVREAIGELERKVPLYALLPNVTQYVRDSSDAGLMGAALKRVRQAGSGALIRMAWTGLTHTGAVLRSDFSGLVPVLLELESATLGRSRLEAVVLAAALTDIALAGAHQSFFAHYVHFVRHRFHARAGLETHNLGHLLPRLREWGVKPDLVIAPLNPRGLLMKPTPADALAQLRASDVAVVAKEVCAGGTVGLEEGARFARSHGARGIVADLVDLDDVGAGLRALRD